MQKIGRRRTLLSIGCILLFLALFVFSIIQEQYYLAGFLVFLMTVIPLLVRVESYVRTSHKLVFIAVLSALAAVSRLPFSFIPGVQPASVIILITGFVLGPYMGWIVGANTALASNFFLGHGPWTPWQMLAWSMMGLSAGWMREYVWMKRVGVKVIVGFVWGILFGWVMNLPLLGGGISSQVGFMHLIMLSAPFDFAHALSNAVFIWWIAQPLEEVLIRYKRRFGIE